uniref:C-type lectin domain-containing protein n=1 Tax=Elaeophora elaphi TaxID=1147741 RepID=A0A0R3RV49_9BILA
MNACLGSYAWKDSSPVTFLNWAEDEPADARGRILQQCVKMQLSGNYTWHSISCWQSTHFLCSAPVVSVFHYPTTKENDKMEVLRTSVLPNVKERKDRRKLSDDNYNYSYIAKAGANDRMSRVSPSQSMGTIDVIGEIMLIFIAILSVVGGIQLWRRKRRLRLSNQRIIQFDQLQNEEENTM